MEDNAQMCVLIVLPGGVGTLDELFDAWTDAVSGSTP